ncbi:intracellular multiplication protein IcmL [Rhodoblastus acidophilus]|uniref:DotI/IcmL family type IV secretion protein n=1 Tax=Rhodoblastus acidophilus TaxID=1074 RepID=UPI002224E60F|nr:DotI/IcmL family type IV secretion protein [Rhodoblastus acidophilus]MCW2318904.1 intracellular multiplication protein IcmL [Rhodoblastus acidophilus]
MDNQNAAIMRKLSDPDFQAGLVNKSLALVMALCVILVAFIIHDIYIWANPPTPKYFVIDGKNPPKEVKPVDSPIMDDTQLLNWTVTASLAPYNVNYNDYAEQLNRAGRKFSANGWKSFAESYISSGNFDAMKKGMLLCYAQSQRAAIIVDTSFVGGALTYKVQAPIVQTCQNSQQANSQKMMLTASVKRTNAEDHTEGLMIDQLVAKAQ